MSSVFPVITGANSFGNVFGSGRERLRSTPKGSVAFFGVMVVPEGLSEAASGVSVVPFGGDVPSGVKPLRG